MAANLHLVVGSTEIVDLPRLIHVHAVPGAVHALALEEGVRYEAVGRQPGPSEVPAGQTGSRDVQFAVVDRLKPVVEDVGPHPLDRVADWDPVHPDVQVMGVQARDRGLGGPVGVDHPAAAHRPLPDQARRAGRRSHEEALQGGDRRRVGADEHRRRHQSVRHTPVGHLVRQVLPGPTIRTGQNQDGPGPPRGEDVLDGRVEGEGRGLQDPTRPAKPPRQGLRAGQGLQTAVRDHRPLGEAGRARGVDDVGR